MKILCVGEEWKGSNASALFYALTRKGMIVSLINEQKYISASAQSFFIKGINKLIRPLQIRDFNKQLVSLSQKINPDWVLIYKGAYLKPETIQYWKQRGLKVVNFFPDVSFSAHGRYIPQCIPLYDYIFTTKSFGAADLKKSFNYPLERVSFIPHGFDPLVHRVVPPSSTCDASFIGNSSPHKIEYLDYLVTHLKEVRLKIWGGNWHKGGPLDNAIQSVPVLGDAYAEAINSSTINIALLSEVVKGASSGDQITSRTFHIPASGGFMLHQRSSELQHYFREDDEVACFGSKEELVEKVRYYLTHESERERIRKNGYTRAQKDYSIDQNATRILALLEEKLQLT